MLAKALLFTVLIGFTSVYADVGVKICPRGRQVLNFEFNESSFPSNLKMSALAMSLTGRRPSETNSNCFNAAAIWYGYTNKIDYSSLEEIMALVRKYFYKLPIHSEKQFGDLIVFRQASSQVFEHVAVFINSEMVWHKRGSGFDKPWKFEPVIGIVREYFPSPSCRWADGDLEFQVDFYRQRVEL